MRAGHDQSLCGPLGNCRRRTSVPLFDPAAAVAACVQWKVPPEIATKQGNGVDVVFRLKQKGSRIYGKAVYRTTNGTAVGNVGGVIAGNRFHAKVLWTYSGVPSIGIYFGEINSRGSISDGKTYDEYAAPSESYLWYTKGPLLCN